MASLQQLNGSVGKLLSRLNGSEASSSTVPVPGIAEIAETVERYWAILKTGYSSGDGDETLKGANLLTTVNRGVVDKVAAALLPGIEERAFDVTKHAIDAARSLRAERR